MSKPAADPSQPYRSLIAGYTDAIRASDFKANIAILFVAFMMGPILYNYTKFPIYLPIHFVLLPFLIVYIFVFLWSSSLATLAAAARISSSPAPLQRKISISVASNRR